MRSRYRGLITSLKYPVQAHQAFIDLKSLLNSHGAFKSILEYEDVCTKRNRPASGGKQNCRIPLRFQGTRLALVKGFFS